MKNEAPGAARPKWDSALLVCKDCGKRSHAPKAAKPKRLAAALRSLSKRDRTRPRIVMTSCLGLCPKGATAVASVGGEGGPRIVAIARDDQLAVWLTPPRETPPSDDR